MRRVMAGRARGGRDAVARRPRSEAQMRRGPRLLPNLPVMNQNGEQLKFYDDLIKDKIVVVMFIYTSCTDICPLTTARMTQIEDKLGRRGRPRHLHRLDDRRSGKRHAGKAEGLFARRSATGPGWTFVTGKPEDIRAINYKLGERSKVLSEHRNEIVLGNDATGEWQRDNVMGDIDRLALTIRAMDPKWRDQVRPVRAQSAMNTGMAMGTPARTGDVQEDLRALPHHRRRRQGRAGPARRHRAARPRLAGRATCAIRRRCWRRTTRSRARWRRSSSRSRMPNMRLSEQDADDLISYLQQETAKLVEAAPAGAEARAQALECERGSLIRSFRGRPSKRPEEGGSSEAARPGGGCRK